MLTTSCLLEWDTCSNQRGSHGLTRHGRLRVDSTGRSGVDRDHFGWSHTALACDIIILGKTVPSIQNSRLPCPPPHHTDAKALPPKTVSPSYAKPSGNTATFTRGPVLFNPTYQLLLSRTNVIGHLKALLGLLIAPTGNSVSSCSQNSNPIIFEPHLIRPYVSFP